MNEQVLSALIVAIPAIAGVIVAVLRALQAPQSK